MKYDVISNWGLIEHFTTLLGQSIYWPSVHMRNQTKPGNLYFRIRPNQTGFTLKSVLLFKQSFIDYKIDKMTMKLVFQNISYWKNQMFGEKSYSCCLFLSLMFSVLQTGKNRHQNDKNVLQNK